MTCSLSFAQSTSATLDGQVRDTSGGAIAGAKVDVVNEDTGARAEIQTNSQGIYSFPTLAPGKYRVRISKEGFQTILYSNVVLNIQDVKSIAVTLPVGSISNTVTVEGSSININTTDGSVSTVVDQTYVANMPLNGRSFQDLISLTPGVMTGSPQTSGPNGTVPQKGEFSVNGQRTEENYYTVDGVSANVGATPVQFQMTQGPAASGSVAASTALGTTQALVSVDDLQEFRVQSSTYSAEYGRNPGGQFAFETKSGTNLWHGTAYDYLRNSAFDAPDYFTNYYRAMQPALRQNDFGGTLGGPVNIPHVYNGKDKTFFFVSYEGLRLTQPQAAQLFYVPDLCLRGVAGACTGLTGPPTPGNPNGAPRQPAEAALLPVVNAFPVPTAEVDPVNGIGSFVGGWSNFNSLNSTSIRFDQVVNDKMTLFFRFSDTNSHAQSRPGSPVVENETPFISRTYTFVANNTFSSRVNNDFRLNYSSNEASPSSTITALGGSAPVNLASLTGLGQNSFPEVLFVLGANFLVLNQGHQINGQRQWNLIDTVSYSRGAHQFKFGADFRRLAPFQLPSNPLAEYVYISEPSIESGQYLEAVVAPYAPNYPLYKNFSAFAQDDWKASRRFNLSFGLRWEVNPAPGVTQGALPYTFVPTANSNNWALSPAGTPLWRTTWANFAPRLGAAYILRDALGWETVVRGGVGVFFDTGQQLGSIGFTGPGYSVTGFLPSGGPTDIFPNSPATQIPPITVAGPQYTIFGFSPHLQLPYTLQWNASIQQSLGKSQAFTVSYVGSHGVRLLQQNEFMPSANPNALLFRLVQNGLTSDYDALQAQFQRSLNRGLTVLGSYTWSHCIDYGSVNFLIQYQRGDCDFDVRQNLSAAISYTLPNMEGNGFVRAVLGHWGVDDRFTARTSFPVFLPGNTSFNPMTGQQLPSGEDTVLGQPLYLYGTDCTNFFTAVGVLGPGRGTVCPGGKAINPCAFYPIGGPANNGCPANPTVGGLAPRNATRGFGAVQMDMAVRREFPIHENLKLQFRAEAFNLFNHPNFGSVSVTGTNFGLATLTLANSLGVLSPQYQMGGPRSMQFALKLIF